MLDWKQNVTLFWRTLFNPPVRVDWSNTGRKTHCEAEFCYLGHVEKITIIFLSKVLTSNQFEALDSTTETLSPLRGKTHHIPNTFFARYASSFHLNIPNTFFLSYLYIDNIFFHVSFVLIHDDCFLGNRAWMRFLWATASGEAMWAWKPLSFCCWEVTLQWLSSKKKFVLFDFLGTHSLLLHCDPQVDIPLFVVLLHFFFHSDSGLLFGCVTPPKEVAQGCRILLILFVETITYLICLVPTLSPLPSRY